jgi:ADP-heptose:LPS heptosyltransferase
VAIGQKNIYHSGKRNGFCVAREKIIILRALPGLGDMLCITPTLAALRSNFPKAHISLIGQTWARDWAARYNDYIDRFLDFPGFPGMESWGFDNMFNFLKARVDENYDWALQVHGSGTLSNTFLTLMGAANVAGYYTPGYFCPDVNTFLVWHEEESEAGRYLRLLRSLGLSVESEDLIFPILPKDEQEFKVLRETKLTTEKPLAIIHAGASSPLRICPMEVYSRVVSGLGALGFEIVLTGTANEFIYTRKISEMAEAPVIDLCGQTTLGSVACLLKNSALLICADTGISHLAAAMKTKSVVLFMENPPSRWAPLNKSLHKSIDFREWAADFPVYKAVQKIFQEIREWV